MGVGQWKGSGQLEMGRRWAVGNVWAVGNGRWMCDEYWKNRHSKGGCVDLVMLIITKCIDHQRGGSKKSTSLLKLL